jgi:hypothetical protein
VDHWYQRLAYLIAWRDRRAHGLDPEIYKAIFKDSTIPPINQMAFSSPLSNDPGLTSLTGLSLQELEQRQSAFKSRLLMALVGGLALIAPMLVMVLHPTLLTRLLTTSTFVVAVSILLSWKMETAEPKDIVVATAAYAAVLVVFVGTGSG